VTAPPEQPIEARLLGLAPARRATVALLLADVVLSLGDLAPLTPEPLSALAESIRGGRRSDVEEASTTLRAIPALQQDEEPDGPEFFTLGAVVGWIYAADTVLNPNEDKPIRQTFARVNDVLYFVEDQLGIGGLCDQLYGAITDAARGDDRAVIALRGSVDGLVEALRT
jgi:hypothetical protein